MTEKYQSGPVRFPATGNVYLALESGRESSKIKGSPEILLKEFSKNNIIKTRRYFCANVLF